MKLSWDPHLMCQHRGGMDQYWSQQPRYLGFMLSIFILKWKDFLLGRTYFCSGAWLNSSECWCLHELHWLHQTTYSTSAKYLQEEKCCCCHQVVKSRRTLSMEWTCAKYYLHTGHQYKYTVRGGREHMFLTSTKVNHFNSSLKFLLQMFCSSSTDRQSGSK